MSSCWEFAGRRDKFGYGKHGRGSLVHRSVFEAIYGYLPSVVRHRCDNPACYNPAHLLPGTQADNVQDMLRRGRGANQSKTHCPQGHEYSAENTRIYGNRRYCVPCNTLRSSEFYYNNRPGGNHP